LQFIGRAPFDFRSYPLPQEHTMTPAETTAPFTPIATGAELFNDDRLAQAVVDLDRPAIYTSAELLQGRREAWIEHGNQMYRLRLTHAGKLYLTKWAAKRRRFKQNAASLAIRARRHRALAVNPFGGLVIDLR
jgi:hemin uptake protein HemP